MKIGLKILDRYIIRKFLGTFFFSLALIIVIAVVFDISEKLDDFIERKAPFKAIIFVFFFFFFSFFVFLFVLFFVFFLIFLLRFLYLYLSFSLQQEWQWILKLLPSLIAELVSEGC